MRQRFVAPPPWQPEIKVERRIVEREATHASVLIPLVLRDEMTVLLTQRTDHLNDHPGQISFPGGRAEASDADATATALREAHEEIGLEAVRGRGARQPADLHDRHRLHRHAGGRRWCSPARALRPDPIEVAEVFEVPLAWLMNPANHQRHAVEVAGSTREFFSIPWQADRRQRHAAALLHLGRDRGDAAQPVPLSRRLKRARERAGRIDRREEAAAMIAAR